MSTSSNTAELLICAYTLCAKSHIKTLIFGTKDEVGITYAAKTSKGFEADETQRKLITLLKPLTSESCPLHNFTDQTTEMHWVKPVLVCEVKHYNTPEKEEVEFLWLREDKNIHEHIDKIK